MSLFVFDAYGTLFDVHAAIRRFSTGPDAERMSEIWRAKQLEYSWTLTLAGHRLLDHGPAPQTLARRTVCADFSEKPDRRNRGSSSGKRCPFPKSTHLLNQRTMLVLARCAVEFGREIVSEQFFRQRSSVSSIISC